MKRDGNMNYALEVINKKFFNFKFPLPPHTQFFKFNSLDIYYLNLKVHKFNKPNLKFMDLF